MVTDGGKNLSTEGRKRGFAAMDENKQRQIASKGGKSVPPHRKFSTDPQFASKVGRKGGQNVPADERSFFKNRQRARPAGREAKLLVGEGRGFAELACTELLVRLATASALLKRVANQQRLASLNSPNETREVDGRDILDRRWRRSLLCVHSYLARLEIWRALLINDELIFPPLKR